MSWVKMREVFGLVIIIILLSVCLANFYTIEDYKLAIKDYKAAIAKHEDAAEEYQKANQIWKDLLIKCNDREKIFHGLLLR